MDSTESHVDGDICRVCRMEGTPDKPLHYPCLCTGSIKYIHQDCLVQWLNHSKKEYCELCTHKFVFKPVYSPDMPTSIPPQELLQGLGKNIFRALRFWLHYTLVVLSWLGVVPLIAYRIYKCLFSGSLHSLLTLPMDMLSLENAFTDCLFGVIVVAASVGGFIFLLWLREQILVHGGPDWLNDADDEQPPVQLDAFLVDLVWNQFLGGLIGGDVDMPERPREDEDDERVEERHQLHEEEEGDREGVMVDDGEGADEPSYAHVVDNHAQPQDYVEAVANDDFVIGDDSAADNVPINEPALVADEDILLENNVVDEDDDHEDMHNNHAADEGGWNPDAIMEDLTWEKFLGLDGSFIFLEHVFWIISLNTSFVLVFVFCPYHFGEILLHLCRVDSQFTGTPLDSVVVLKVGYVSIACGLVTLHTLLRYTTFKRFRKTIGLCYTVLKVSLLMTIEVGLFPLVCGWWLDICSLPLFAITTKDRKDSFLYAPATATFLHWLVGMLYVFYFAAFIMLLREILRPGVLWFLRNINDPQFHPVREMIQLNVLRHTRRFILSLVVFGTTILVIVWLPVQLVKRITKSFIPFNVSLNNEAPVSEMSLELLLLQVILPTFLEQGHARRWLKTFIQFWAKAVSYILNLRSYLIGDIDVKTLPPNMVMHVDNNGKWQRGHPPRGTPLENQLEGVGSPTVRAYSRTKNFRTKMLVFTCLVVLSFVFASFAVLTAPVFIGRKVLSLVFGNTVIHELYTSAAGFYILWLFMRLMTAAAAWYPVGLQAIFTKVKKVCLIVMKIAIASIAVLIIIPMFLGILFELVVVIPLRVPLDQTALLYVWQDWALGVLHLKILCAVIMVGPDWWLRDAVDTAYRNGFANMNLMFIIQKIVYPVLVSLLLAITAPYVAVAGLLPLLGFGRETVVLCLHRVYPLLMLSIVVIAVLLFQGKQFKALYEKIKNEKYLIGRVLVNYEPRKTHTQSTNT